MLSNVKVRSLLIPIFIIGLTVISRADGVIDWNVVATNAAFAAGKNALEQSRIYAMTHAAIHDALNSIDRRYKPYALDRRAEPGASPDAAAAPPPKRWPASSARTQSTSPLRAARRSRASRAPTRAFHKRLGRTQTPASMPASISARPAGMD
ncbi:MAG TPA: hypothetical protein VJ810_20980 [Blastocatellia bacterium]|nr:hypothetical protein [Blastocatellia bacterium]